MIKKRNTVKKQKRVKVGSLPESWTKAFGILKGKKIDAVAYQREIRAEWEERFKRQLQLANLDIDAY